MASLFLLEQQWHAQRQICQNLADDHAEAQAQFAKIDAQLAAARQREQGGLTVPRGTRTTRTTAKHTTTGQTSGLPGHPGTGQPRTRGRKPRTATAGAGRGMAGMGIGNGPS